MNAGPVSASSVQPEPGPAEYIGSIRYAGASTSRLPSPPTDSSAAGTASPSPTTMTASCAVLIHAEPSSPPDVK